MNKELQKALARRDEALADVNVAAMLLASARSYDPKFVQISQHGTETVSDIVSRRELELEQRTVALEDVQTEVAYWRAVERGRQSLG